MTIFPGPVRARGILGPGSSNLRACSPDSRNLPARFYVVSSNDMRSLATRVFYVCLGLLIAVLIRHAQPAPRRDTLSEARAKLAAEAARASRLIPADSIAHPEQLDAVLSQVRRESRMNVLWIRLRNPAGAIQAKANATVEYAKTILIEETESPLGIVEIAVGLDRPPQQSPKFTQNPVS